MKHIMISVKAQWAVKILNKEKTLEVRKSAPKEVLKGEECLVEIYCTKDAKHTVAPFKFIEGWLYKEYNDNTSYACGCTANMGETINGKVVARWLLKCCEEFECSSEEHRKIVFDNKSCLTLDQVIDYCNGQTLYGWHIQDLEIYDKPKQLEEFGLKKAPQSWQYIKGQN